VAVKLRIELEQVNDDELARLQKRLVDLRAEAGKLEKSLDLAALARNARASGQTLKDALDLRAILQNTEKELQKQQDALLKTGDVSEQTAKKLEELRQKQQQLAEQREAASGKVGDAKLRVTEIDALIQRHIDEINKIDKTTEAYKKQADTLRRLREIQDSLSSTSNKANRKDVVRGIKGETPGITADAAERVAAERAKTAAIIAEIRRRNEVRKQVESQQMSAEMAAAKEKSHGIITSIRAQHFQQKKAEQELTAWMEQQEKERADLEKAMIAQAKQDVKELNNWLKQQDRERTEDEAREARLRADAKKKADEDDKRIKENRRQFIRETTGDVLNQGKRAGQLQQVQSDTVRLEGIERSLSRRKQELEDLIATDDQYQAELDQTDAKLEEIRDQLVANDQAMRRLASGIDLTITDFARLRDQLVRVGASQEQINRFDNAVQQLNNTLLNVETTKAIREAKDLQEVSRQAERAIRDEEDAIRDLQRRAEQSKTLANKQLVDIEQLQQAREEAQRFADSLREADRPTQEMVDALREYDKEVKKLTRDIEDLRKLQGQQADVARKDIAAADAALTNAEATGTLTGRTEELRMTQGRLGREMDNVDARAKKTGLREMFSNMVRGRKQTDALRGEQQYLAKALIDSAQAWFLNTRASNEAFNVAQRIFKGNIRLQASIIGVVAAGAALVGVNKANNALLKEQAKLTLDGRRRFEEHEQATKDLKNAFLDLATDDNTNIGGYMRFVSEAMKNVKQDFADLTNNIRDLGAVEGILKTLATSELMLTQEMLAAARETGVLSEEEYNRSMKLLRNLQIEEDVTRQTVSVKMEALKSQLLLDTQTERTRKAMDVARISALEDEREIQEKILEVAERIAEMRRSGSVDMKEATRLGEIQLALEEKRSQVVAKRIADESAARKKAEEYASGLAEKMRSPVAAYADEIRAIRELAALGASSRDIDQARASLLDDMKSSLAEVNSAIESQRLALLDVAKGHGEAVDLARQTKDIQNDIDKLLDKRTGLLSEIKTQEEQQLDADLQRRVQLKAALDVIKEQRKEFDINPGTGSTFDYVEAIQKLQAAYKYFSDQYGKGSKEAAEVTDELRYRYEQWVDISKRKGGEVLDQLEALKKSGEENTEEVKKLQREYESWLKTLREAQAALAGISTSKIKIEIESDIEHVAAKIEIIKAAMDQMKEQGLVTPADNIRNRISEKDVEKEARRKRAEGMDAALEKWSEEFRQKNDRGPTSREQAGFRRSFMRKDITDEERLGARKDLTTRFIDSLEGQKAIGKETAEALRQQLETESKSLQAQIETRDAIKALEKANSALDETNPKAFGDKAKVDAVNPDQTNYGPDGWWEQLPPKPHDIFKDTQASAPQQPMDVIAQNGNPIGQGMNSLNQGVSQNTSAQKQLGEATGQAFEAMSQAFAGVANGQQQLANFLVALAGQVAGQSNALQNSVAQTMSRGGAALRNV